MFSAQFISALAFTLREECRPSKAAGRLHPADDLLLNGLTKRPEACVDDPKDRGGRTAYGVTQRAFNAVLARQNQPERDVWLITADEVKQLYLEDYWNQLAVLCPQDLALAVFDTSVLHGVGFTKKRLQAALGVKVDGNIGPKTKIEIAVLSSNMQRYGKVLQAFLQARDDRYEAIVAADPSQSRFYRGWEGRLDRLCDYIGIPRTLDR